MDLAGVPVPMPTAAFLSSPTGMIEGASSSPVRERALEALNGERATLFVSEVAWKGFDNKTTPALEIASALMTQLRLAERVIFLLIGEKSGSAMQELGWSAPTTFFELEIFQSIVLGKPTYLLVHESFNAESLGSYLDLLGFAFADWRERAQNRMNDSQAIDAIKKIATGKPAKEWRVGSDTFRASNFHDALFKGRDRFLRRDSVPIVHFMDLPRRRVPSKSSVNIDLVSLLIRSRKKFDEEENNDTRLAYSWLTMRELMAEPLLDQQGLLLQRDPFLLSAWNLALGDWHGAASWSGLHSHIQLGTIPTLGTIEVVRRALGGSEQDSLGQPTHFPGGAYASSYYSLSRRVSGRFRLQALEIAKETIILESDPRTQPFAPGLQSLMASIALESGNSAEAVEIFERVVSFHLKFQSGPRDIGQSLCELAFARMFAGDTRRAAAEAAEGLRYMGTPGPNGKSVIDGFLIRAMFKTSVAHARAFQLRTSVVLYRQALREAKEKRLFDQYEQWRPRGIWRRLWQALLRRLRL